MNLHLEAATLYVDTAGNLRTPQSKAVFLKTAGQLQGRHPRHRLTDFTTDDLTAYCLGGTSDRPQAPNSIRTRMSVLRPFFDWAAWKGLVKTNPATALRFTCKPGTGGVRPHTWLTEEQVAAIYRSFDGTDVVQRRDRLIFLFGATLGLRRNEIAQLAWEMFTADCTQLSLVGKGRKLATLPVPEHLSRELVEWRAMQPAGSVMLMSTRQLFDFATGIPELNILWDTPLGPYGVYRVVRRASLAAGIPFAPHDLRRSFAGVLDSKGVPLQDIQGLMRHEGLGTTDRYLSRNPARLAAVVDGMRWDL